MNTLFQKAYIYATNCHESTNHLYDGMPYTYHLKMVDEVAQRFSYLLPSDKVAIVRSACLCHDVIEDTRQTYNDVKKTVGEEVAEIVYALTNEKGRNRKERANVAYYKGIRQTKYAEFVKLCDRIANVQHSKDTNSRMLDLYKSEQEEFRCELDTEKYPEMWYYLEELLK